MVAGLSRVVSAHDILRIKGFVEVPGKPLRLLIQGVGDRIDSHFDRPWRADEARRSELVVIGLKGLDQTTIAAAMAAAASGT